MIGTISVLPGMDEATVAGRLRASGTSKSKGKEKQQREYTFRVVLLNEEEEGTSTTTVLGTTQWLTFGEIRNNMKQFEAFGTKIPRFPAGSFFGTKDHVHNLPNATARAHDLAEYYTAVIQTAAVGTGEFQKAIRLENDSNTPTFIATLNALALSKQEHRHSLRDQDQIDCDYAQRFNHTDNTPVPVPAVTWGDVVPELKFKTEQSFVMQDLAQFGASSQGPSSSNIIPIVGENEKSWFRWMTMDDPTQLVISTTNLNPILHKKYQSVLTNMNQEPLLFLKEKFARRNYYCELSRYVPTTGGGDAEHQHVLPICSVKCSWNTIGTGGNPPYRVKLLGPWSDTTKHKVIQCHGRWPHNFTLGNKSLKTPFATCHKRMFALMYTLTGIDTDAHTTYELQVSPGEDCLLFVGICCAIDRIHNAINTESERQTMENYT